MNLQSSTDAVERRTLPSTPRPSSLAGYADNYAATETVVLSQTNRAIFLELSYA